METRKNFHFFAIGSLLYAFIYTLFLYNNTSGITYPFFVGGTCLFFFLCLKRLGITAKKDSVFYVGSMLLLGISTCMTNSWPILFFNKAGIFLLMFCLMLHTFYEDAKWTMEKYMLSICNLIFTSIPLIIDPFRELSAEIRLKKESTTPDSSKAKYVIYGLLIACPLCLIILGLLISADQIFANLVGRLFRGFYLPDYFSDVFGIVIMFCFAFFASYCIMDNLQRKRISPEIPDKRTLEPVIAITFTSLISVIYLIFSVIQVLFLFLRNMKLPAGYSYATYARQGFFQLLFVCLLNLAMVLFCLSRFQPNKLLKVMLTVISFCTFIMILSSALRMILYIQVYDLTFLRFFVLWALLVIFVVMIGVMILIYKENFPLFRYILITVTIFYLALSFCHPDYWIAKYNIKNNKAHQVTIVYDSYYLFNNLSLDAAPAILQSDLLDHAETDERYDGGADYLPKIESNYQKMSLRSFNFSIYMAHKSAEAINK